ncbi:hypothetical protein DXG03_001039 [Asterophora parasitica]|uniref:Wings apart-like protein C-terminal domain-containing protein n=1 Tax=Asterophora parasitica TaxID=117018 RepID=A0A9P7G9Z0_9AGAR|nr:hypothetical protein DXG03_001039 [Asterophora parasitica]
MSSTYNARTYGRRKRKQSMDGHSEPRKKLKQSDEEQLTDVENHRNRSPTPEPSPSPLRTYGTPQRPAPVAKDLSEIFQSCTPTSSPHATPTKLARRMLGRSKTDSSIGSTMQHDVDRTASLPALFSSPSSPKPGPSTRTLDHEPHPPPIPLPTNTRTYAGKSRSFLVAIPASSLDPLAVDNEDEYSARESYASLRSRWGVDNSEDDPYPNPFPGKRSPSRSDASATPTGTPSRTSRGKAKQQQQPPAALPNGMMNPLKSITELRNKGESRRFLDEVGYLFEGMHASVGIGLRRSSALEITMKLCDADFARKAKAADFLSRAWDVFGEAGAGRGEDKVLDTLLALFTALISRDPSALRDLAQRPPPTPPATSPVANASSKQKSSSKYTHVLTPPHKPQSVVDTLFALLAAPADPLAVVAAIDIENASSKPKDQAKLEAELRKMEVGKKERVMFQTIHTTITSKSFLFPAGTGHISTPLLLLHALHALPPSFIPSRHLPLLLRSLKSTIACLLPLELSLPAPAPISRTSTTSTSTSKNPSSKSKATSSAMERTTSTSSTSSAYLSWPDHAPILPYETAFLHLCLLDAYLLGQWGRSSLTPGVDPEDALDPGGENELQEEIGLWLIEGLVAFAVCAELASFPSSSSSLSSSFDDSARTRRGKTGSNSDSDSEKRSLDMALRVLVSLTHAEPGWARRVAENECAVAFLVRVVCRGGGGGGVGVAGGVEGGVKKEEGGDGDGDGEEGVMAEAEDGEADRKSHTDAIDTLCLALGLLTNLIQGVPGFGDVLRDTHLDPTCALKKRTCIRRCACAPDPITGKGKAKSRSSSALDVLVRVYSFYQPPSSTPTSPQGLGAGTDADALFLRGHLAVVFGLLIRGSEENEAYLLLALTDEEEEEGRVGVRSEWERAKEREVVGKLAEQAREFVAFYTALGGIGGGGEPAEDMRVARDVIRFLEARRW